MTIFYNKQRHQFAKTVAIALLNMLPILAWAQHDTVNKRDNGGLKQGYWIEKAASDCDSCEFLYQEGQYKNDKKECVWKFSAVWGTETIEYHNGLKVGLQIRKEMDDTIIDAIYTYSNDTLIDRKSYAQLTLDGTAITSGKFLFSWYYLNPKRDTLMIRYYKPDSSQKTLGIGYISNFLYEDYLIHAESTIPPLPSYCRQKYFYVSYFEKAGLFSYHQNVNVSMEIIEKNTRENFEKISLYDSTGLLMSETISIRPAWINYSKDGFDSSNILYWYSDTNLMVLHQNCSKEYPSKTSITKYTSGQLTYKKNAIDYGKGEKFVTILTYDTAGHKVSIYLETSDQVIDSLFFPSGKIRCIHLTKKQANKESVSVWYFENNAIRKTEKLKDGKLRTIVYFEDGKINFAYFLDEKRETETRQIFNSKGKLICSFKRKGAKVKWVVYDEFHKKTTMQAKTEMTGELPIYIGCEFDETIQ